MATTTARADRVEHTAPGEEQVVFSRKAGVVASKISYVGVLDSANDWQVLESPHEDEAPALACQFNHLGTHFMVGDEGGRIDLWSLAPLRLFVKSLDLTPSFLNTLIPLPPFTENANGSSPPAGTGTGKEKRRHGQEHGWSTPSVYWSRCSRYVVAAYVQKKKTWPDGEEVQLPGMVLLWNVVEAQVEGYLRLRSRVAHVSLSPMDPRRGSACCLDGTSFLFDFPPVLPRFLSKKERHSRGSAEIAAVDAAKTSASIGAVSGGDRCANVLSSTASAEMENPFAGRQQQRQQQPMRERVLLPCGAVADSRQAGTDDLSEHRAGFADIMGDGGDGTWKCSISGRGCGSSSDVNMDSTVNAQRARIVKIWDPVQQLQLFSAVTWTATGKCSGTDEKTVIEPTADTAGVGAGFPPGSGSGGVSGGGGSGSKPQSRTPVQPGRAAWCEDGETIFLLTHEGNLVKIKASANGDLSLLAIANLHGGASPATLQLTPEGDKLLVATATKGLCLVPSNDLDLSRAEMFGETFGMRGSKTRFWGAAVLGDVHGRGADGSGKRSLTIIGNPSRSRDEKTDLFFFDPNGGQPERVDTPRREGVICLACSSLRPLLVFLCPTGEVYFREEVLKTDFPGPWYPSGYVLIDNNVDYLEAEDQLDTVVMTGPNGEELSKTQAHEIVVPWQHQAVSEEEASTGTRDEPVDIDGGGNTDVWAKAGPAELRWIPQDDDAWRSLGGEDEGSGCPGGSSRGGVQESCGGTLARLLGATPSILNESKKRFRAATASEADAAVKRRKMVPKMMEILAAKKKKYDEEVFKRKRKLQESRAKAKGLKDKKAASASAEKAALQAASEEAEREETAQNEEAALRANANATATGQGAADDAAADVYGVVVNGKDTARELRPLLAKRGDGGASKRRDVAACDSLLFGSAGSVCGNLDPHGYHLSAAPAHDIGAPEYTPCIGSKSLVGPDVWCPPGGGNDTGVDSLPLTGGAAAFVTPWVPVSSMAGKYHQGAAAYAAPTGASIDGNCSRSSLSTKRPGEMLWKPPASHACLSVSTSCSFSNLSGHLALKTNRHNGGDHGASSGTSGRRGAAGAAQEYCGPAGLQAEYAPASIDAPACPQAAGVMYGLTTSQAGEAGRWWDKSVGTKGGCTTATTEVPLFADAREEASGGVSPFGGIASDRQRIPGEHGVCGVLYSGVLNHEPHSSLFPTDSPTDSRGGGYGSLDVGSGRHVAPSRAMQVVGSTLSSFSPLSSSDRRIPSSGASCSTPLSRGSSHRHCCSSQSSCLHHFASPSLGNQRPKTSSPPILLPHTFRGISASTEALPSGRSDPPPTSSASSPELMRHIIAETAVLPVGSAGVSATPHNSWNQDLRRSMPRGVNEGDEPWRRRPGFKLLENVLSPQKDESQRASNDGSQVSPSPDM